MLARHDGVDDVQGEAGHRRRELHERAGGQQRHHRQRAVLHGRLSTLHDADARCIAVTCV
jgi:hypothetical protein